MERGPKNPFPVKPPVARGMFSVSGAKAQGSVDATAKKAFAASNARTSAEPRSNAKGSGC